MYITDVHSILPLLICGPLSAHNNLGKLVCCCETASTIYHFILLGHMGSTYLPTFFQLFVFFLGPIGLLAFFSSFFATGRRILWIFLSCISCCSGCGRCSWAESKTYTVCIWAILIMDSSFCYTVMIEQEHA